MQSKLQNAPNTSIIEGRCIEPAFTDPFTILSLTRGEKIAKGSHSDSEAFEWTSLKREG